MASRKYTPCLAPGVLAALVLLMFGGVLFATRGRVLGSDAQDMAMQFMPMRVFAAHELRSGRFPLWNPHIYSGTPFFGGLQSALLYPPNLLALALPVAAAINWSIALHTLLFGLFAYAWARVRGLGRAAGLMAGGASMFCGAYFLHVFAGHLSNMSAMPWAALIFLAIDGWIDRRQPVFPLFGMAAVTLQILSGQPQYLFYTGVAAGLYALVRLVRTPQPVSCAAGLLACYAGGAALGAVQLLPALQTTSEMVRSKPLTLEFASSFSLPPENLLTLIAPGFFGPPDAYWGRWYLWESTFSIGAAGLILAVFAAFKAERRRVDPLLWTLGLTTLLALGSYTPLYGFLYRYAPEFNRFRGIGKFAFAGSLILAMLAAEGFDLLLRTRRVSRRWVGAIAGLAAILAAAAAWIRASAPQAWGALVRAAQHPGESWLPPAMASDTGFLIRSRNDAALALLGGAAVAAAIAVSWALLARRPAAVWIALAAVLGEAFFHARATLTTIDAASLAPTGLAAFYAAHPGDYRVLNLANPNSAMIVGGSDLWGFDPVVVRRYAEWMTWTQGASPDDASMYLDIHRVDPLYALLRLRYITGFESGPPSIAQVLTPPLPHVSLVSRYRAVAGREAVFQALRSPGFDMRGEVVLEAEPDPRPQSGGEKGSARVVAETPDSVTIEADAPENALLLITDLYTPSWRAEALPGSDQKEYRLMPADYILRGIPLAAGHHRLRVEYAPRSIVVGLWISIVSAIAYGAAWIAVARRRIAKADPPALASGLQGEAAEA